MKQCNDKITFLPLIKLGNATFGNTLTSYGSPRLLRPSCDYLHYVNTHSAVIFFHHVCSVISL